MGLILTIQWESNEQRNVEWSQQLQALAEPKFGSTEKAARREGEKNYVFAVKQITSGCGTCGNLTEFYRKHMQEFAKEACATILKDAINVSWDLRDATRDELR